MKIRRIDKNWDWTFGNGIANYATDNEAVLQNVATRIKSFKYDWFLDNEANIDWFKILSMKDNEDIIKSEIERVVLESEGVIRIKSLEITKLDNRRILIELILDTIYEVNSKLGVEV